MVRVMTWNIRTGVGNDPTSPGKRTPPDLERIARVIQTVNPDIVALQEVDRGRERTLGVDQPEFLGGLLRIDYRYGPNLVDDEGEYGIAILTPHPVRAFHHELLPGVSGWEPRGYIEAVIDIPGAEQVTVVNTHLQVAFGDGEDEAARQRRESAAIVAQRVLEAEGPALLTGDFNAEPTVGDLDALSALEDAWISVGSESDGKTFPATPFGDPETRIDAVFANSRFRVEDCRVLRDEETALASDHYPVVVELDILES